MIYKGMPGVCRAFLCLWPCLVTMQFYWHEKCLNDDEKEVRVMRMLERSAQLNAEARGQNRADKCRRKFLRFFPRGFRDPKYFSWERGYKEEAHNQWNHLLNRQTFQQMLKTKQFIEIGQIAARIESRTNLLFSFEKMAFRDAVKQEAGARTFAEGLYELLYGRGSEAAKFENWCETVGKLPRAQTRVLTHPVVTVFPFIADPARHIFLKPTVTKRAADAYGYDFHYNSRPSWEVYSSLLGFAGKIQNDLGSMKPKDMIDIQSFIWVLGSDEYA
jgi:hypothetical protein